MKIALLTNGIYPYVIGGMQKHSYYLTKFLAQNGVNVDLYHTQLNSEHDITQLEFFTPEEKRYIRSIVIDFPENQYFPGHYILESKQYSEKIFQVLKNNLDVNFIYAKSFTAWQLLIEKNNGLKVPPVGINFHGYEMYQKAASFKVKLEHLLLRQPIKLNIKQTNYVFSYGGKVTNIIKNIGVETDKIIEIPTGIEAQWLNTNIQPSHIPRKLIFLGRYERRKGIEELMKVIQEIVDQYEFSFHFIGPIPEHLRLSFKNIHYHGQLSNVNEIKRILRSCDVLVCPSYSEGMPNVILEAMASGLAVIATDVGAVSAMVSEQNGWLISPGSKHQLHQALINAIHASDEELTNKKRKSQSIVRENFTWDKVIQKTINKIQALI